MYRLIFALSFCFFISCNQDESYIENVSLEQRTNSTKAQAVGDDIIIGTICPECDEYYKNGDGSKGCLKQKHGVFKFTIEIWSQRDFSKLPFGFISNLYASGTQVDLTPVEIKSEIGHWFRFQYVYEVEIPVEEICGKNSGGGVVSKDITVSFEELGEKLGDNVKKRTINFCCN